MPVQCDWSAMTGTSTLERLRWWCTVAFSGYPTEEASRHLCVCKQSPTARPDLWYRCGATALSLLSKLSITQNHPRHASISLRIALWLSPHIAPSGHQLTKELSGYQHTKNQSCTSTLRSNQVPAHLEPVVYQHTKKQSCTSTLRTSRVPAR